MNENELREYFDIINECGWKLLKNHANPVDADEFWKGLVAEQDRLIEEYKGPRGKFAEDLTKLVVNEVYKIHRVTWRQP